jgi:homoserine kinase
MIEAMIRVRVPATIANFGPAFDAIGVAVTLYNTVELERATSPQVEIHGEGHEWIPPDASNLTYRAAAAVADQLGKSGAFHLRCVNGIPVGRGLGSSAAAIVGGIVAANTSFDHQLGADDLLQLAWRIEGHPDNVAAALEGGVVLTCLNDGRVSSTRIAPVWSAALVIAVPEFMVPTDRARAVLPDRVPLRDAVANLSRASRLLTAMLTGSVDLLPLAMEDTLHQPYRRTLVPGMDQVFAAARSAGAYGVALCGSGPSIVAVTPPGVAERVGDEMVEAFRRSGARAKALRVDIDRTGAQTVAAEAS